MTDNKGRDNQTPQNRDDSDAKSNPWTPEPEPDMGFAGDPISTPLSNKLARRKDRQNGEPKTNFIPANLSGNVEPQINTSNSPTDSTSISDSSSLHQQKTFVPDYAGNQADLNDMTEPTPPGNTSEDVKTSFDVNKTWVPNRTPIQSQTHQTTEPAETANAAGREDESPDVNKTWVPSATPTVSGFKLPDQQPGITNSADENGSPDLNKTWVPSATPTHHDFSFAAEAVATGAKLAQSKEADEIDPDKTLQSPPPPAFDGADDSQIPENQQPSKVFEQTAIIDHRQVDLNEDDAGKVFTGNVTVILNRDESGSKKPSSDDAASDTVVSNAPPGFETTQVFTQSMGMRGLTEDEYKEWQDEVAEKSSSDTAVFDHVSTETTGSSPGRRTQIWSKQSGSGLNDNLTIRHRPVAGSDQFRKSNLNDEKPDYHIIEKLAEGGMGAIYIATQTSLDRELAIKTLKPMNDGEKKTYISQGRLSQVENQRREMFLSEALVTANLVHPHIIPIHDLCQTNDGFPFYSMKRVHGTPWNELIGDMPLDENLEVLHKVCDAMAYAHHNGVVNRDLKPENIMLGEFGEVLVLDWGLAVPATVADKNRFASPSASFGAGTPAYMAPELWTGPPEAIGSWSDIYLLGAILFEAITGTSPHTFPEPDSKSGHSGLWMIIDSVVRGNEIRRTEHKGELMDIAMKAMSTLPKERHRNVLEFQEAIKNFQKHDESRRLAERADETLQLAKFDGKRRGYQNYQTAAALFEQAFVAWPDNKAAAIGLRETRLAYAGLAHVKGDYDLGLQIAEQERGKEFTVLRARLAKSRRIRNGLKYAMGTAMCLIAIVGTISFVQAMQIKKQNKEITRIYGEKESLEGEKNDIAKEKSVLEGERKTLLAEKDTLNNDKELLTDQKETLVAEKDRLESLRDGLEKEVLKVEKEKQDIQIEVAGLTEQKARAKVELKNAFIASLIRSADYPAALLRVEELLNDKTALADLPEEEREVRIQELKARKDQLEKRTSRTEVPVQTQVISPTGRTVIWGDSDGQLIAWKTEAGQDRLPETPLDRLQAETAVSHVVISQNEELVVAAAGRLLYVWEPEDQQHEILQGHESAITAIALTGKMLLSADASGTIKGWNVQTKLPLWSIRTSSSIRSLAVMPKAGIFLYAGSRGGESSDVMAYPLPSENVPTARLKQPGQLRFPRSRNDPPYRLSVSPDEQILLISNSRNGDLMSLPRIPGDPPLSDDGFPPDWFPFEHAADLLINGFEGWVSSEHQRPINDIEFSADGRSVVTASDDRTIGIWQVKSSELKSSTAEILSFKFRMLGHGAKVNAAGFLDRAGTRVLSASADRFCRFWDVSKYQEEREAIESEFDIEKTEVPVQRDAAVTFHSRYILTASKQPAGRQPFTQLSSDGDYVVVNANAAVQRGALTAVSISDDGSRIVTGASDGTAVIWNANNGQAVAGGSARARFAVESGSFEEGHDFNVARLRFLPPAGKVLITTGFDGNLCLWNADLSKSGAGAQEVRLPGLGLVNAIATSSDGVFLAASMSAGELGKKGVTKIWKTQDILQVSPPDAVVTLDGYHDSEVSSIAFSSDGSLLATGARDGRVAVWMLNGGTFLTGGQLHAKNTIVSHLEWLPNGDLVTAGFDGRLQLLHPEVSKKRLNVVTRFQHEKIPLERLTFSPDRSQFVTISIRTEKVTKTTSQELQLWSIESAKPQRRIFPAIVGQKSTNRISAINWSDDGNRMAAAVDGNLQVFRTSDWKIEKVLDAPGLGISDAVFAPQAADASATNSGDEAQIFPDIIATFDGTAAHLWDLNNNSHLADFRPLFAVKSTALSSNTENPLLLTGDRAIRIFDASENSDHFGQTLSKISEPHKGVVTTLCFAQQKGANRFVSGGADGSAVLWEWNPDSKTASKIRWLQTAGPAVAEASWAPNGKSVLLTNRDGVFIVVDTENPQTPLVDFKLKTADNIKLNTGCFSYDGCYVAVAGQMIDTGSSVGWVYDLTSINEPRLHATITGHEAGGIRGLAFLPNTPYLVTGGTDGAAIIWNWQPERSSEATLAAYEAFQLLADGETVAHKATISSVAVSVNGSIATASEDGTAIIWRNPFQ